ncbi:ATP-dependent DNA helicase [Actinomyces sp. 2119]|uniref:ATP-dependent DNA helicase n=2 Tax=Actinomycetaceae TaxID=2049 RepID=A0ABN5PSL4_9ACTO|nr:ATP-dependent DNA helicase [Actinomyces lilanjuaniae]RJF42646.1 ATP-dependent DNA helicase [Actinomyces sp. 2119]
MAAAVGETLQDGGHLLVQAGTGTGKSLAYLVPVMLDSVGAGHRVVVSTATLALQRQVLAKDAPVAAQAVERATGSRPRVALLKGWHNYLCRYRLEGGYPAEDDDVGNALFGAGEVLSGPGVGQAGALGLGEQVVRLREWARTTDSGDRDDLVPGVSDRAWRQVSVSRAQCLGHSCPVRDECFPRAARSQAAQADIVVTNHAVLGVVAAGGPGVLPDHQVLVVDEAHELAERVRSQGTVSLSGAAVARAATTARRYASVLVSDLEAAGQGLAGVLDELPDGRLGQGLPPSLRSALVVLDDAVRQVAADVREKTRGTAARAQEAGGLSMARQALADLVDTVDRLTSDAVDQGREVAWVERPGAGEEPPRLMLAPVDVASRVATTLLAGRSTVLTSATLVLGGGFGPMARTLGLTLAGESWRGFDVGSPFDYPRQGILYAPTHLPRPGSGVSQAALEEMLALAEASGGGMLGLFSSRLAAQEAAELLRSSTSLPVYAQGEDQLPTLVEAFASDDTACLVGSLSLWQGVDVPGRTCRLVVIDRIPFPRPDDPVVQARTQAVAAAGGNGFMSVAATHAALLLAQGAGRLIRRRQDRGVVAVLDPRLRTARYGGFLSRSLPPLWPTSDPQVVLGALTRLAAHD